MNPAVAIAVVTAGAALLVMAGEAVLSNHNERWLRTQGAVEPLNDVYQRMRFAYPLSFVVMAVEGALTGPASPAVLLGGLFVFGLSKALKVWAISSLGTRWSYKVLVLPGAPLVARGPYTLINHPNYVAVLGELIGMAAIVWAPLSGALAVLGFGELLRRRIVVEDRALGRE